jgi:IPT/TIG domain
MRKHMTYGALLALIVALTCVVVGPAAARSQAAPTITGFAPNHGLIGEKVTIYGHNLAGARVWFNGVEAMNPTVDSTGTHVTVNVPGEVSTGPAPVMLTTPGGTVTATATFMVNPPSRPTTMPKPRISTFAPHSGNAGTKVTIVGKNLGGTLWVKFGGVKATYTVPSATKIVAVVPRHAHSGRISVHTRGGTAITGMGSMFKAFAV